MKTTDQQKYEVLRAYVPHYYLGSKQTHFSQVSLSIKFPADYDRRELWKKALKISNITKLSAVCHKHFKEEDYQDENGKQMHLKDNAEPISESICIKTEDEYQEPFDTITKRPELTIKSHGTDINCRNQIEEEQSLNETPVLVTHVCGQKKRTAGAEPWEEFGKMSLKRAMESSSESDFEISDRAEIRRKKLNRLRQDLPELRKKVANLQKLNFKYKQRIQNFKETIRMMKQQQPKVTVKKPSRPPRPKGPQMSTVKNLVNEMIRQEAAGNVENGRTAEIALQENSHVDNIEVEYLEDEYVKDDCLANDLFNDEYLDNEFLQ
ncbi:hypothetical protein DMENIID0001_111650 [Sergentomyia squamirostris]